MKVVQQTFRLLTLQERPIGIWILSSFTGAIGFLIFIAYNPPLDSFGLFCIAVANLMMFTSPTKTCHFDKALNRITFKQKRWLATKVISYSLNEVIGVDVEYLNIVGIKFYRLSIKLLAGQRFYLTPIPSTERYLYQRLALCIQQFLKERN